MNTKLFSSYKAALLFALVILGALAFVSKANAEVNLEQGGRLYNQYCAKCHGTKGLGDGPKAPSLQHKPTNLPRMINFIFVTKNYVAKQILEGNDSGMPSFKDRLTKEQALDIVNYIQAIN